MCVPNSPTSLELEEALKVYQLVQELNENINIIKLNLHEQSEEIFEFWEELELDLSTIKVIYKSFADFYKLKEVFSSFKEN
uniref:Uncharacterized protein n=1 Tax=Meloidogyne enterolobii TaxID=390850 RepID=A0A6V7UL18_MELEN|nr:unnamed protein product [Meloidogyne enterolobii]